MARHHPTDDEFEDDRNRDDGFDAPSADDSDAQDALDRDRFASQTAYCPECGAEIFDAADVCPKCFTWLDGETSRHHPTRRGNIKRWQRVMVWTLIASMLVGAGVLGVLTVF